MLNISNGGDGDFVPWVKYNAKAGRWYVKGDSGDVEVQNPVFVAEFDNIKTGWFYFSAGVAPERVLDPSLTEMAPKPDDGKNWKRGFAMNVFSQNHFGGVVELSSTSNSLCAPINELYAAYETAPEAKEGKLPVLAFVRADAVTGKHGTNYTPVFEVQKWVPKPSEFAAGESSPEPTTAAPAATPQAQVAAGGSEF